MAQRFTAERRAGFVGQIEPGRTLEDAYAAVGVARSTVFAWRRRGAHEIGTQAAAFGARLEAALDGGEGVSLSEGDLVRLLERAARKGSVQAAKLLLQRVDRADGDEEPGTVVDEFAELDERAATRHRPA